MRLIDADEVKKREHDVTLANGAKHRCFDTTRLSEIPTLDVWPKWTPCSKRLPDERGFYLVRVNSVYRPIRVYEFDPWELSDDRRYWRDDTASGSHVFDHFVNAWMQLPSPAYEAEK